jgi:hypothetical protein
MRKLFDAVATIGKYKDREGNEKKRYVTVGSVFEDANGRQALKLDALPTSPEWTGWIAFYEPKQGDQRPPRQDAHNQAKANGYAPEAKQDDDSDEIPF